MIRFSCEHCGYKIGVEDAHTAKRGKCPACGTVVTVPAESTLIEFDCGDCGRRLAVPRIHAGRKVVCPKCENVIIVPAGGETSAVSISIVRFACSTCNREIQEPESSRGRLVECPHCGNYVAVPSAETPAREVAAPIQPTAQDDTSEERFEQMQKDQGAVALREPEPAVERKLPWLIDIFLYPTSTSGLIHLVVFVLIPLLIAIVRTLMGPLGIAVGLPGFLLNLAIGLYLCWFITECVRDSAKGGTRAPEAFATSDLGDMWSQALHIMGCYLILLGPVGFYHAFTEKTDAIFWLLLAYGAFFFPMGLLACIMFDSIRGLNPILLVCSIFSTILHYVGLILLIVALILAFSALPDMQTDDTQPSQASYILTPVVGGIFYGLSIYVAFVIAHLIGRFYWRNQEKLNWEV